MRYLVTGGSGFIGSHVVEALLARQDQVLVLDDLSTGSSANLAHLDGRPGLEIAHGSVCDQVLVDELCLRVDRIIHLAAAVGVRRILERQVNSIVTNLHGTEVVLRAAHAHGRMPVFYASTSEVYGKQDQVPFREDLDSVLGASALHRWSYACSKLMDEFLALAYHRERKLPVIVARFFNVTGPRQSPHYGMVLPRFCEAAIAGRPLEVHGDGQQARCFLHVSDAVTAITSLIDSPQAIGQVVNIGSSEEVTITGLAEQVITAAGSRSTLAYVPYEQAFPQGGFEDMRRRIPDVTKLQRLTGWSQQHDLASTITESIRWCRDQKTPAADRAR
ncbi:MAG: GDP-mannose 4,6-dehydratase [Planctomycetes bacterium]|nr:GDP-mannose 4,6-dehydratase [Planctomycetota bacterium]